MLSELKLTDVVTGRYGITQHFLYKGYSLTITFFKDDGEYTDREVSIMYRLCETASEEIEQEVDDLMRRTFFDC